jgi:hypothetical protein
MRKPILLLLSGCALALLSSCATPGAPLPPSLQLPRPVEDLNYIRKGSRVVLSWTPPSSTTEHLGLKHPGATYICRTVGRYPVDGCDMVKRLSPSDVALVVDRKREQAIFEDALPENMISPAAFATYSIEVSNDRGRSAGLSNQVRVPLAPTLPPPQNLRASVTAQGPELTWDSGAFTAISGLSFSYRILRRLEAVPTFSTIDTIPANAAGPATYVDRAFEWQKRYEYKIVPVTQLASQVSSGRDVEGDDSAVIAVEAQDVFPPAKPTSVQAVFSSVGQKPFIDLSWTPNTETDLAGYEVYRREGTSEPMKINAQPVKAPSFRDDDVRPGAKYFYSVVAIDLRNNQSSRSDEANETVPADLR